MKSLGFSDWRAYLAEFLGTFVYVFVAAGSVLSNNLSEDIGVVGVAVATGLALTAMIFATVGISGGHLNPAVTLSLWLAQRVKTVTAIFYILMQIAAGFTAAVLLNFIFGNNGLGFYLGGPVLAAETSIQAGVVLEAVLTAAAVFVLFATMVDKRGPVSFGPIAIGLMFVVAGIFAGPITGAALNPARAIGPLLISGHYDSILVWVIGPFTGSVFGLLYELLFLTKRKKKERS